MTTRSILIKLSDESGLPVPNTKVWIGEFDNVFSLVDRETDENGRIEFEMLEELFGEWELLVMNIERIHFTQKIRIDEHSGVITITVVRDRNW